MRYRRNGKQVLCDDEHFANARSDEAAALICLGLNRIDEQIESPVDEGPDLFEQIVPDDPHSYVPVERCSVRQYADQYACTTHKTQWDVDDTPPDSCEVP